MHFFANFILLSIKKLRKRHIKQCVHLDFRNNFFLNKTLNMNSNIVSDVFKQFDYTLNEKETINESDLYNYIGI